MIQVDVVVDRLELLLGMKLTLFQDCFRDNPAVEGGIALHNTHIVKIVIEQIIFTPGYLVGNCYLCFRQRSQPFRQEPVNLTCATFVTQLLYKAFLLFGNFCFALIAQMVQSILGLLLVVF